MFNRLLDRQSIIHNDTVRRIQERLQEEILRFLTDLASREDPKSRETLDRLMALHGRDLMEGCLGLEDDATLSRLAEMLRFSTTHAPSTTLPEYLERAVRSQTHNPQRRIFYYTTGIGNRQLMTLVRKRQWELVDCRNPVDLWFLQKYTNLQKIRLYNIAEELDVLFDVVEPHGAWKDVIGYYQQLVHSDVRLVPKLAHNANSEMLLTLLPGAKAGGAEGAPEGPRGQPSSKGSTRMLYINKNNPLLQRLVSQMEAKAIDRELVELILHEALHQIALFSDEMPVEPAHLFEHHQKMLLELTSLADQVARLQQERLAQREGTRARPEAPPERSVFVGVPFRETYLRELYLMGLKPVIEGLGYKPVMLQEATNPANIPNEIVSSIARCAAAIFDVSEPNVNVYYELGLAHGFAKMDRTILICNEQVKDGLAFDTRHFRVLTYSLFPSQFQEFCSRVRSALDAIVCVNLSGE